MKNCYFLNFKEQFIKDNIVFDNNKPDKWQAISVPFQDFVTSESVSFLDKNKIFPYPFSNFFIGPPNHGTDIHIDPKHNEAKNQSFALNYVWGSKSKMRWYKKLLNINGISKYTTSNLLYNSFLPNQVELVEEIEVPTNTLMLVRIDVPHQVVNYSNTRRYCLSIRGHPQLSWEEIIEYLQAVII